MEARVYNVIRKACASNTELLHQVVDELDRIQTEDGFFETLLKIGQGYELEMHRVQALVQFKNRIIDYWGTRSEERPHTIDFSRQNHIRQILWDTLQVVTFPKNVERQWHSAMAQVFVEDYLHFD
ncbi:Importin-11, partial [Dispira simplex]